MRSVILDKLLELSALQVTWNKTQYFSAYFIYINGLHWALFYLDHAY